VNPKLDLMRHFLNHFRIFAIETFRLIPQFQLRDLYGYYFKDRIIFLMDLLEIKSEYVREPR
jgi:hypothetical protein